MEFVSACEELGISSEPVFSFFSKLSWGVSSCSCCPSLISGVPTVVGLLREPHSP